jgi:anti-anti-sigma regulatory factor
MDTLFAVELREEAGMVTFILRGNIDVHAETEFRDIPDRATGAVNRFDFSEVGRINSMGIAHLLRCFKKIKETTGAEIALSGLSTVHTMLFKTTGVFLLASRDASRP